MDKEEIEKVKEHYIFTTKHELDSDNKRLKKYIQYLEQKSETLDKVTDKLKETTKKERELMPYLPHKSASFNYANGREVLAKEILEFIEGEKNENTKDLKKE